MQELLKYQDIDIKLRKLQSKIDESENRKNATEMQDYVKRCLAEITNLEQVAKTLNEQYQKSIAKYNEFISKLESLEKSIESSSDDTLAALQSTLQSFAKNAEVLEGNIEMLAKKVEATDKKYELLMSNATKARKKHDAYKAEFLKEKAVYEQEIQKINAELVKQGSKVNPTLLAKYKVKSDGKKLPVLVPETNGRCYGCKMEIPARRMSDLDKNGFIECENERCGKIIYKV